MEDNLQKIRKFALIVGFLLFMFSIAGISLNKNTETTIIGIPFVINSPDLISYSLILLSIYSVTRYYYYGVMLTDSPYRKRKKFIRSLDLKGLKIRGKYSVYFGPDQLFLDKTDKLKSPSLESHVQENLTSLFPKVGSSKAIAQLSSRPVDNDSLGETKLYLHIRIPRSCRLAALVEDTDYFLPITANTIALATWLVNALSSSYREFNAYPLT